MNFHNITHDDMLNGDGIRVVLWVAGCEHHCKGCQNPVTWNPDDGEEITTKELEEIYNELSKSYVSGITFSGGDPLHPANRSTVKLLVDYIRKQFPDKTIWIYSGYTWEEIKNDNEMMGIVGAAHVLVDGRFEEDKLDKKYHWAGSTNQRVIDVQETIMKGKVIFHESNQEGWNNGRLQSIQNCQCGE